MKNNQVNNTPKKPVTQCEKVLDSLREKGSINPIQALRWFGCFSLAARIYDLKKAGHHIISKRISKSGRYGRVNFAEYSLESDSDE